MVSEASYDLHMDRPLALVTESISPEPLRWLGQHCCVLQAQPTPERLAQTQALIIRTYTRVDAALLDHAPMLRVVARAGVGLDNIDLDTCKARGIQVVHTPEANSEAVAEYVISMMLTAMRPIEPLRQPLPPDDWAEHRKAAVSPRSCVGARLGVIGLGRIGLRVARAADALGMQVSYHDVQTFDPATIPNATPVGLERLAQQCDIISVHVDASAQNRHLLNTSFFASLRPDVVLINAARGLVLDTHAACAFAQSNPGARLILDVHDPEPIPTDSPLWGRSNIVLTPHIAAGTDAAKEAMSWVVRDVVRVLNNQAPQHPAYSSSSPNQ